MSKTRVPRAGHGGRTSLDERLRRNRAMGRNAKILAVVRRIPRGRVATYGQVARLAGLPGQARQVGYALHQLAASTAVPWQRVVNAGGGISLSPLAGGISQRLLLEAEGIEFDARGRIRLARFEWRPRSRASAQDR